MRVPTLSTPTFPSLEEAKLRLLAKYNTNNGSKTELTNSTDTTEEEYSEDEVLVPLNTNEDGDESTVTSSASKRAQTTDHVFLERPVYSHMRRRSASSRRNLMDFESSLRDMEINIPGSEGSSRRESLKRLSGHFNVSEDDLVSILSAAVDDDDASLLSAMVESEHSKLDEESFSKAIDLTCKRAAMMFGVSEIGSDRSLTRRSVTGRRSQRGSVRRPSYFRRTSANSRASYYGRMSFTKTSSSCVGGRGQLQKSSSCRLLQVSDLPKAPTMKPTSQDDFMVGLQGREARFGICRRESRSSFRDNNGSVSLNSSLLLSDPSAARRRRVSLRQSFSQQLLLDDGADLSMTSNSGSLMSRRRSSIKKRTSVSSRGGRRSFTERFLYDDDGDMSVGCSSGSLHRRRSSIKQRASQRASMNSSMRSAMMEAAASFDDDNESSFAYIPSTITE